MVNNPALSMLVVAAINVYRPVSSDLNATRREPSDVPAFSGVWTVLPSYGHPS